MLNQVVFNISHTAVRGTRNPLPENPLQYVCTISRSIAGAKIHVCAITRLYVIIDHWI